MRVEGKEVRAVRECGRDGLTVTCSLLSAAEPLSLSNVHDVEQGALLDVDP